MAKKSKGELIVEKLDSYILENFRKIPHLELHRGISSIISEYRNFKGINPATVLILTLFRYKKIDFFKTFNTVDEIEKYFQNILTNYCIKAQISIIQIPNEIKEDIKKYYYQLNSDVKKFDELLKFYFKVGDIEDKDIQKLIKLKKNKIDETINENPEILKKSIYLNEVITKILFK
uniref:hypothetical protein n=1 Tax=Fusobacterium mortiferum TaxID=850 RepID=UPI003FED6325